MDLRRLACAAVGVALVTACSSSDAGAGAAGAAGAAGSAGASNTPPDWNRDVTPPADDVAASARTACGYGAGALPAETQGASHPMGDKIPIDHIVISIQENRSFDHYFWKLPEHGHPDADVAPADFTNPDVDGTPVAPFHDTQLCFVDTAHSWNAAHTEWDGGKMDGFILANDGDAPPPHGTPDMGRGIRAMGYYEPADLPFMYWAADEFAIGDHYHCSVLTSTWTNRMYLYAANSFGRISNDLPQSGDALTLFDELTLRGASWKVYHVNNPPEAMFVKQYLQYRVDHYFPLSQFYDDAAAGQLPNVSFVEGSDGNGGFDPTQNDEHPPSIMQTGQALLADVAKALVAAPTWSSTAYFITYDEHGGLWDHVPPPPACPPDDTPPDLTAGDAPGGYDRLGVRVPFVVISPYAKRGFIGHHTYDHTSIVRFVESRFTLPAMSRRDANAEAPWEMFDFSAPRTDTPVVPDVAIDQAAMDRCVATFAP